MKINFPDEAQRTIKKVNSPIDTKENKRFSKISIDLFSQQLEMENAKEEETETEINDLPKSHFSENDVLEFWNEYITKLKQNNAILYTAICNFKINKIDEDTLRIQYPSESAKMEFEKVSAHFFSQLKQKINHFSIEIQYEMNQQMKKEKITRKSIFDTMVEKTPLLAELNAIFKFDLTD